MSFALSDFYYLVSRFLNRRPASIYRSQIDKKAKVRNGTQLYSSRVGRYSYIFESKVICTDVGAFCSIASDCTIGGGAHPITWVSTSPVFTGNRNVFNKNFSNNVFKEYHRTVIGNDVWIGSKSLIKGGVSIGDGAIIGMGSVVTHNVPPYEIWAGNPAKLIRKRFDEETIQKLLILEWWKWDEKKLSVLGEFFYSPEQIFGRCQEDEDNALNACVFLH